MREKWNVINDQDEGLCAGGGLQSDLQFLKSASTEEKNTECHCDQKRIGKTLSEDFPPSE